MKRESANPVAPVKNAMLQNVDLSTLPTCLVPLEELEGKIPISIDRVRELTESGYMPCWRIDGGEILFKLADVRRYIAKHLVQTQEGIPYPRALGVVVTRPAPAEVPTALCMISNLLLSVPGVVCGIYFLVDGDEVVYVGQSVDVAARVPQHTLDKTFSRSVFLPVAASDLTAVEHAFIHLLRPKYNKSENCGRTSLTPADSEILAKFWMGAPQP
jgi:hypothetical protein